MYPEGSLTHALMETWECDCLPRGWAPGAGWHADWLPTRLGEGEGQCLIMTYQWGSPAWDNLKINIACLENYLELCVKAKYMYTYDPFIQLLDTPIRKLLHSPKVMYKSICVSTIHNSTKMKVLTMSIRMQMCRSFWSMRYHIATKMNKVLDGMY